MSALQSFTARAYQITRSDLLNRSVGELEARPREARAFISRIRRNGNIIEAEPDTVICEGDVCAVLTRSELLGARGTEIGTEVHDEELLDFPIDVLDVVITNKTVIGKTIIVPPSTRSGPATGRATASRFGCLAARSRTCAWPTRGPRRPRRRRRRHRQPSPPRARRRHAAGRSTTSGALVRPLQLSPEVVLWCTDSYSSADDDPGGLTCSYHSRDRRAGGVRLRRARERPCR